MRRFPFPVLRPVVACVALATLSTCSDGTEPADGRPAARGEDVVEIEPMASPRAVHAATPLPDGTILVTGGCVDEGCETRTASTEIYDPSAGSFRTGPAMNDARVGHTATRLADGRVLVTGGWGVGGLEASAEVYDPATGAFEPTGPMNEARGSHHAVLLGDGSVLVLGGEGDDVDALADVERFDPARGTFEPAGSMTVPRTSHVTVSLADGRILVVGGRDARDRVHDSAEIFDPVAGTSTSTAPLRVPRHKHDAIGLADGSVLVVGGSDGRDWNGTYSSAEVFDPDAEAFEPVEDLAEARFKLRGATVALDDGRVVVAGGDERVEVYDPAVRAFATLSGTLGADRFFPTATRLADGSVLVIGGYDERVRPTARAWRVRP